MYNKFIKITLILNELEELVRLSKLLSDEQKEQCLAKFPAEEEELLRNGLKILRTIDKN